MIVLSRCRKEGEDVKRANDLTVKETVMALRICFTPGGQCSACPLFDPHPEDPGGCVNEVIEHAADLLETMAQREEEE